MTGQIFELINTITDEAGALAPEKSGGVPFSFRGVDQVVAHLAPHLTKHGVVVVPEVLERTTTAREVGSKTITQTDLLAKFTFYAPDGSSVSATTAGLAQDFADRSAAQAQSVAFRVALLQTFKLPTHSKEPEEAGEDTQRVIAEEQAKAPAPAAKSTGKPTVASLKNEIQRLYADAGVLSTDIQAEGDKFFEGKGGWATNVDALTKLRDHLKAEAEKK